MRVLPSPPHPVVASRRRPSPGGGGRTRAHDSSPLADKRVGRARGDRASPGAGVGTVSTKQIAPRGRFPRALRLAALVSGLAGSRRRPCGRRRAADMTAKPSAARTGSARRAGGRHPSTSSRTPGVSIPRAPSLDHSPPPSRTWIRRPPHRRDGGIMGAVRGRLMIPFEKTAGRWKGGGFLRQSDYESADCERSVMAPLSPPCSRSEWGGGAAHLRAVTEG